MTDYDLIGALCFLFFAVGWTMGRWRKGEGERRKEEQRFERMINKRRVKR